MINNKYYVVCNELLLCGADGQLAVVSEATLSSLGLQAKFQQTFHHDQSANYIVLDVEAAELANFQWQSLRSQLGLIAEQDFQLAGRALQILRLHVDHQFCGRCGRQTDLHKRDLARRCHHCELDFYPRLSPCIITLVTRDDYCLLALHSRAKTPRYSCLAGFIEAGESPEQTLVREVMEEVGISVGAVRYHSSQPWPFPGQLMLGYFADYHSGEILVDPEEIVEAQWFRFDQLPEIPPPATISGRLIAEFVRQRKSFH